MVLKITVEGTISQECPLSEDDFKKSMEQNVRNMMALNPDAVVVIKCRKPRKKWLGIF